MNKIDCRDCLNCKTKNKKIYCSQDFWVDDEGKSKTYATCYIFNEVTDEIRSDLCRGCENYMYMGKRVDLKPTGEIKLNRNNSIISMLNAGKSIESIAKKHNVCVTTIYRIKGQAKHYDRQRAG